MSFNMICKNKILVKISEFTVSVCCRETQSDLCQSHWSVQGFFLVSSGAEIRPLSQWDLGDFFPNLKKKFPISKKKKNNKFFFFLEFSFSHHTHTLKSCMTTIYENCILFAFNLMAIVCVIANFVFKLTKNAVLVCLEKFPK